MSYLSYYLHVCGLCKHWVPQDAAKSRGICKRPKSPNYGRPMGFDCMAGRRCPWYNPGDEARKLR